MCRVYGGKKSAAYVRLCYRFGHRRGEKVYFDGDAPIGPSGHYNGGRAAQSSRGRARLCALCFVVPSYTSQNAIDDMARRADAQAVSDGQFVTLNRQGGWRNADGIIARAKTFGWVIRHTGEGEDAA